jgi:hypothetical protein
LAFALNTEGTLILLSGFAAPEEAAVRNLQWTSFADIDDTGSPKLESKTAEDPNDLKKVRSRWLDYHSKSRDEDTPDGDRDSVTVTDIKVIRGPVSDLDEDTLLDRGRARTRDYFVTAGHEGYVNIFPATADCRKGDTDQTFLAPRPGGDYVENTLKANRIAVRRDPEGFDWDTLAVGYQSGSVDFDSRSVPGLSSNTCSTVFAGR